MGFSADAVSFGGSWWLTVGRMEQQIIGGKLGGAGGGPATFVHQMMMKLAEQNQIAPVGPALTAPVDQVVCLTPAGWGITAGEDAATVA